MYTLSNLIDDCAESPKHSKADAGTFKMVWGGLMAWTSSNWMTGKGDHSHPSVCGQKKQRRIGNGEPNQGQGEGQGWGPVRVGQTSRSLSATPATLVVSLVGRSTRKHPSRTLLSAPSPFFPTAAGIHLAPMGKFVFFAEELDLGTRKKLQSKVAPRATCVGGPERPTAAAVWWHGVLGIC